MFISFNTQSILIPKIQPIKKEYNAKANVVNTPADFVSFEGNANYKNTKSFAI
jgi:hypothetical protein